eukprot:TRINITY_DN103948_c0_g1_i1.p1 TRINITY_DN103948_c0_g1~~TRINITY_DN103948_c0_g1_i1.p1  ORF type:complete len:106 (+),score=4.53 TRINITY_DN103948_c0_g1_i1:173-490(+)
MLKKFQKLKKLSKETNLINHALEESPCSSIAHISNGRGRKKERTQKFLLFHCMLYVVPYCQTPTSLWEKPKLLLESKLLFLIEMGSPTKARNPSQNTITKEFFQK